MSPCKLEGCLAGDLQNFSLCKVCMADLQVARGTARFPWSFRAANAVCAAMLRVLLQRHIGSWWVAAARALVVVKVQFRVLRWAEVVEGGCPHISCRQSCR